MSDYTEPHDSPTWRPALSLPPEQLDGSPAWISQDSTGAQQSLPRVHQHLWQPPVICLVCILRHTKELLQDHCTSEHHQAPGNFWNSAETATHPAGQDTEGSLMDVHDGIVLPFVAIHLLQQSTRHSQKRDTETPFPLALSRNEIPMLVNTSLSCRPEHSLVQRTGPSCSAFGQVLHGPDRNAAQQ